MAFIKVIKFSNGIAKQIDSSVDSIEALSFKVGGPSGTELTKAILDTLTGGSGSDASTLHQHDSRYYQKSEFISSSAGAGDSGKPVKTNTSGKIDASMIDSASSDHEGLTGLLGGAANDHYHLTQDEHDTLTDGSDASSLHSHDTQYYTKSEIDTSLDAKADDADVIKKDGSVAFTNDQSMGSKKLTNLADGTNANDAVNKSQLDTKISSSEKGANNGVATLDAGGKVPVSQLPSSVMEYKGNWNASTNSPSLADGTGNAGDVYRASVAGSQDLGSGSISFAIGDWVVYNGSIWEKSINSNAVASVNGQTGVVSLDSDDISEGGSNLYFTDARAKSAAVVNSTAGSETDQAPSVSAIKSYADNAASDAQTNAENYADDKVEDAIVDGVTDVAPSQNAVFDALALKADISSLADVATSGDYGDLLNSPTNLSDFTNDENFVDAAGAKAAAVADSIADGITDVAPSQNAVFDALALKADSSSLADVATSGDYGDLLNAPTNLSDFSNDLNFVDAADAKAAAVADSISDGVTDVAPSQNAVFDALALKSDAIDSSMLAGESISSGDLICIRRDGSDNPRIFKANSAAASNADFNDNGRWEVYGMAMASASMGGAVTIKKSGPMACNFDSAPSASDIGKSVYLSTTSGKASLSAPSGSGDGIVHLGRLASATQIEFRSAVLRGVLA